MTCWKKRMCTDMLQFIEIYCTLRYIVYFRKYNLSLYLTLLSYTSNRSLVCHISKKIQSYFGKAVITVYVCLPYLF